MYHISSCLVLLIVQTSLHPMPTLFPYTTLFRSAWIAVGQFDQLGREWLQRNQIHLASHLAERFRERSEEHTSELQSRGHLVCRLLLVKKNRTSLHKVPKE